VAKRDDERPRKRFSRSGHTTHGPRVTGDAAPPPYRSEQRYAPPDPGYGPAPDRSPYGESGSYRSGEVPPDPYSGFPPPRYGPPQYGPPPPAAPNQYGPPTYRQVPGADSQYPAESYDSPDERSRGIARAAFTQTNRAARLVTRKVISASQADGAQESGLTALIWNQVLSYGTDAMIAVALAGTVFFGASPHAQRGNILLYLLITMAPFAVVAPIIGPALDRLQHGRRWTMAGTALGRGVLALIMASHPSELLVLYPCALGSLVLSKAYGVVRAAAAPRLVPPNLTLTEANARLSIFGLGSTLVAGSIVGILIKVTGSYSLGLIITAIAYLVCAFFAFRLPPQVDSPAVAAPTPSERRRTRAQREFARSERLRMWARRGFDDNLITALQGESVLRFLSGLLTIFLAFYVEGTAHGVRAALELGGVVAAAGIGNITGTAIGAKLRFSRPELVIIASTLIAAVGCVLVALLFNVTIAVFGMLISAVTNSLSKIALDALIQRDVDESLRSSAFARSETFLQLSWVLGAAVGVALPVHHGGAVGFLVAGVVVGLVAVLNLLRQRAVGREATNRPGTA
jgi:hypothetical protein